MKGSELKRDLKKAGCRKLSEDKIHERWYSPISGEKFSIPRHDAKEVHPDTLQSILRAAGLK